MSTNAMNFSPKKSSVLRSQEIASEMKAEARDYCHGTVSGLQSAQEETFRYCLMLASPDGCRTYETFDTHSEGMEAFKSVFLDVGDMDVEDAILEEGTFKENGDLCGDGRVSTVIWRRADNEWYVPGPYCEEGTYREPQPLINRIPEWYECIV